MENSNKDLFVLLHRLGFNRKEFFSEIEGYVVKKNTSLDIAYYESFDNKTLLECFITISWSPARELHYLNGIRIKLHNNKPGQKSVFCKIVFLGTPYFTLKELYNIMQGRAVLKSVISCGTHYTCWYMIDRHLDLEFNTLKLIPSSKKFGLEASLMKLPIEGLKHLAVKDAIMTSLKMGNLHPVILIKGKKLKERFIAVNPCAREIIVYKRK